MRKLISQNIKYFIIISLSVFITGGLPLEYGSEKNFFQGYSIQNPVVRVGLGDNLKNIEISASSGMNIYEVETNYKLIAENANEAYIKGKKDKLNEKYLVQVAYAEGREKAELMAQELRSKIFHKVFMDNLSKFNNRSIFFQSIGIFKVWGFTRYFGVNSDYIKGFKKNISKIFKIYSLFCTYL